LEIKLLSDRLGGSIFPLRHNQSYVAASLSGSQQMNQGSGGVSQMLNVRLLACSRLNNNFDVSGGVSQMLM